MKPVEPSERGAEYGEQVWRAIAGSLPTYSAVLPRPWYRRGLWLGLSTASACAAMMAAAFYAGRIWEHRHHTHTVNAHHIAPTPAAPPPRVVVVVLSDHLERSERLLVELKHAQASDTELALPLRDEARSLLPANRKARQDAAQSGDPALAAALDHLDELLNQLANQPGGLNATAIARLQDEMTHDGLLFKVRVLRSRIPNRHVSRNGGTV
jgi:uncharacterized membrane protein YccC